MNQERNWSKNKLQNTKTWG